jgi:hypothetical protein
MPRSRIALAVALLASCVTVPALAQQSTPAKRQAFFGDLHLHTSFSADAWSFGTRTTPEDAYRFAKGETITWNGNQVHRDVPLDFLAVTDHAEYMGVMRQLDIPNSDFAKTKIGQALAKNHALGFSFIVHSIAGKNKLPVFPGVQAAREDAWQEEMAAANRNYEPGKFTTFIAYEWSSMPLARYNLHRNVIFSGDRAPLPFTPDDSQRPEDLWTYLERVRTTGADVIDIPHNSNASGGLMFDWVNSDGRPIDEAYAQRRATNEPLAEIYQNKGGSETIPEISPTDEFADFEVMDKLLLGTVKSDPNGSYVRQAEGRGLIIQQKIGVNPYKLGFVGATDYHNGLSTSSENAFAGGVFGVDPTNDKSLPDREASKTFLTPQLKPFAPVYNVKLPEPMSQRRRVPSPWCGRCPTLPASTTIRRISVRAV